ncbi:sensor protein KdpD [Rhizosphaericola mali]|uniref:Sensor protein KdpD n=1 Tax=Rhizosphaericola mali TaxID=2545455 RepID=A0A5P2FYT9_9BACT|nr:sensor protein KdpD [Rhizosphaericola mali]QES88365.1 sensor protein KdpD [Rhizosphaericola mali]
MIAEPHSAAYFLDLIQKSRRGKFKIYIGMSAGVGKTFRMLQEAHALLRNSIDVQVGYVETHNRMETAALLNGLPVIPRRTIFYKGKELEELNLQAVLNLRPEIVLVDELAHTNIEGSKNEKRWQDIMEILDSGINVISALNIQHIESLNEEIKKITHIEVQERVPDKVIAMADDVVNIDLPADELITRLKEGKIYPQDKIQTALQNFFQSDHILQLRELALKEVAVHVTHKVDKEVLRQNQFRQERFLICISSNEKIARNLIRKGARFASYYSADWFVLYVETPKESQDKIALDKQRHLINNYKLATELGANVVREKSASVADAILKQVDLNKITTVCMGKPHLNILKIILATSIFNKILRQLSKMHVDLVILSEDK